MKKRRRVKDGNFINIQSFMVNDLQLDGVELMIYAIIYGFTQDGIQWYDEGLNCICNWVGRNKNTVSSTIDKLEKLGFIEKESNVLSDGNTIYKSIRLRAIYDSELYKTEKVEEDVYSDRYARTSPRDVTKQQVLKFSKELDISNYNCRLINYFVDTFINKYDERYSKNPFSFQSNQSMKKFVEQANRELVCLDLDGMQEIINMYFHDVPTFERKGYSISLHHMVSDGILENYTKRMM